MPIGADVQPSVDITLSGRSSRLHRISCKAILMALLFLTERQDLHMASTIAALTVLVATAATGQPSRPILPNSQWAAFVGDTPRDYRGLWMLFGPSGTALVEMRASRKQMASRGGQEIRETNLYDNRDFFGLARPSSKVISERSGVILEPAMHRCNGSNQRRRPVEKLRAAAGRFQLPEYACYPIPLRR